MWSFEGWDGDTAQARALQQRLAKQVVLEDDLLPLRFIAGLDVGFEDQGRITRAAAVLLEAQTHQPLAEAVARIPTRMPYIPGLLSFRELPALLEALAQLPQLPDLLMLDGQGIAHPRGLGIAAHIGLVTGLPSIGVAKSLLVGQHGPLGAEPGAQVPLRDQSGALLGTVLRSKQRCKPLFISPGHRISVATATVVVQSQLTRYRLPEPTRLADRLASRRRGCSSVLPGGQAHAME